MSGDILELIEENNILLGNILTELNTATTYLSNVNEAISIVTCLIIVIIVIVLLHYSYKLLDIFF